MDDGITEYRRSPDVTIRWAIPADASHLDALAELDEAGIPDAPVLLAFVADELWVAMSLATGEVIGDPFRPTTEIAALVVERAHQLTVPDRPRFGWAGRRRRSGRPRPGRRRSSAAKRFALS